MKKVVLTFGFLSGGVSAAMMFSTLPFIESIGFERGAIVGYTAIVISFLFVFFGIRSYRDNVLGGRIGFGRALGVGLLITLISCVCYVVAWQIVYTNFMPDFLEKYTTHVVDQAKAAGKSAAELETMTKQMASFKELYKNPLIRFALTMIEPLPVGLLITFISAAILRRKTAPALA